MDNSAIFLAVTQRNAIRKAAQLPLLNMRQTYDKEVNLAAWRSYREIRATYAADEARIRASVLTALRQRHGRQFPSGSISWMLVGWEVNRHMRRLLAGKGVLQPEFKGGIAYGADRMPIEHQGAASLPDAWSVTSRAPAGGMCEIKAIPHGPAPSPNGGRHRCR